MLLALPALSGPKPELPSTSAKTASRPTATASRASAGFSARLRISVFRPCSSYSKLVRLPLPSMMLRSLPFSSYE